MSFLTENLWRENEELKDANTAKDKRIAELERENARLVARVNRMAATAPLADVNWRPTRCASS